MLVPRFLIRRASISWTRERLTTAIACYPKEMVIKIKEKEEKKENTAKEKRTYELRAACFRHFICIGSKQGVWNINNHLGRLCEPNDYRLQHFFFFPLLIPHYFQNGKHGPDGSYGPVCIKTLWASNSRSRWNQESSGGQVSPYSSSQIISNGLLTLWISLWERTCSSRHTSKGIICSNQRRGCHREYSFLYAIFSFSHYPCNHFKWPFYSLLKDLH